MEKPKKVSFSKSLVRNVAESIPKDGISVVRTGSFDPIKIDEENSTSKKKLTKSVSTDKSSVNFNAPELNFSLNIGKKIDKIEITKARKSKSATELSKKKLLTYDDKIARKVNFPQEKTLYKDLMPLMIPAASLPVITSREPLPLKDKEPELSDFIDIDDVPEYCYVPQIKSLPRSNQMQPNNLRLYRQLEILNHSLRF